MRRWLVVALGVIGAAPPTLWAQTLGEFERTDVAVPMRDGVRLVGDLWRPKGNARVPVITIRTPYGRRVEWLGAQGLAEFFAARGYAVLVQDVRGTGDSPGSFGFLFQEANDGYDTIEWAGTAAWSNGRVASMGLSYFGAAQWVTAKAKPPHLVCMAPTAAGGMYFNELPYVGGAFGATWALSWLNRFGKDRVDPSTIDWARLAARRPLRSLDSVMGRSLPLYREFLDHSTLDAYWAKLQYFDEDFVRTNLPTLTITGTFDGNQPGALFYWRGMRRFSPAKERQYLLLGPWNHTETWTGGGEQIGAFSWGRAGVVDYRPIQLAWFDYCLKGTSNRVDFPRARVFLTGSNRWVDLPEYPTAARAKALYLRSNGRANTGSGDGRLSWDPPGQEAPDRYSFDPKNPVPSPKEEAGFDQRATHTRSDVLVYRGESLRMPVSVVGPVKLDLYFASDALDTDFTAKLLDVFPDGRAIMVGVKQAIFRTRYRYGFDREVPLAPGKPTKIVLDLYDVAHTFMPGHRIALEVSSSAFPSFPANHNTGNPVATDTVFKTARQMIFHEGQRASRLWLPLFPLRLGEKP